MGMVVLQGLFMGTHILLIDDEKVWLQNLEFTLKRKGYAVTDTDQGREAVRLVQDDPDRFDVLLLDLMMPDMDGLEVLSTLRPVLRSNNLPVIMQTGTQEDRYIIEAFNLGAMCCIRKPYSHHVLCPLIDKIVRGEELESRIIFPQPMLF